jgi:diguanylate cyclase (GGDEF)-like protein
MKIAVLIGGIAYEAQRRFLEGIMSYAKDKAIQIFVFTCNGDFYQNSDYGVGEYNIFNLPELSSFDGIIYSKNTIQSEKMGAALTERIQKSGVNAISIEVKLPGMPRYYVDNQKAMAKMITHLVKKHHIKTLYYLSGPAQNHESMERLKGVQISAAKNGISLDEEHIYYGDYWVESGKDMIRQMLKQGKIVMPNHPTAIVCANDDMAVGVYMELADHNIPVGKDILLTGFDHTSDSDNLTPAITTIEKPQFQMGYEACKALTEKMKPKGQEHTVKSEEQKSLSRSDAVPSKAGEFMVRCYFRGSCGCRENSRKSLSDIQLQDAKRRTAMMSMSERTKNMASDLNDDDNLQDFCQSLQQHIVNTDFTSFYLCLCEELEQNLSMEMIDTTRETYTDNMIIPLAYEHNRFTEYSAFDRRLLLPLAIMNGKEGDTFIVMPLHFRKNCLGYCVFSGSDWPMRSTQFQNWVMNIGSALENIRKQTALKTLINRLNDMWVMDTLTGVFNRAGFFRFADKIQAKCKEEDTPIGIIFIDIDKLKTVNDTYGHEEGDFYIKTVAEQLKIHKNPDEIIMRYGGDEFVVLGQVNPQNEHYNYSLTINTALEQCRQTHQKPYEMSVSTGITSVKIGDDFRLDILIENADKAMYQEKRKTRK